jgi:hypothetical protein
VYALGGGRVPLVFTTALPAQIVNAVETVAMTTPPLNPGIDAAVVLLFGMFAATIGATGTQMVCQFRRGTTVAGVAVGRFTSQPVVAASVASVVLLDMDTPGAVAGQQYVMTGQVTGGSANTVPTNGLMIALALG